MIALSTKWTIAEIKSYLSKETVEAAILEQLHNDERKGVQQLLSQYDKRQAQLQALWLRYEQMSQFEQRCWKAGMKYIAGVDEVGRGPLAGPVAAAAVVLPADFQLIGLDDSKKLSKKQRETFYQYIKEHAIDYQITMIDAETIDQINILNASKQAMYQAIKQLDKVEHVLIDAVQLEQLAVTQESIIKGDQKSISIAAASVMAKVTRDRYMEELHQQFPAYHFDQNSGYGTRHHLEAIRTYGTTPYHRSSFLKSL
ncbi:ribonuclease HII [Gracilibacillus alcaliphilus]